MAVNRKTSNIENTILLFFVFDLLFDMGSNCKLSFLFVCVFYCHMMWLTHDFQIPSYICRQSFALTSYTVVILSSVDASVWKANRGKERESFMNAKQRNKGKKQANVSLTKDERSEGMKLSSKAIESRLLFYTRSIHILFLV